MKTITPSRIRSGFTLVELLGVIALTAVLASLLLPALPRTKRSAQSVLCKSNLRQQGVALVSHVLENNAYPMLQGPGIIQEYDSPHFGGANRHGNHWFMQLDAQIRPGGKRSPDVLFDPDYIFRCPSHLVQLRSSIRLLFPSYGYNAYGVGNIDTQRKHVELGLRGIITNPALRSGVESPTPESEVKVPGDMIAIGDTYIMFSYRLNSIAFQPFGGQLNKSRQEELPDAIPRSHNGTINLLLCDGHVEAPKLEQVFIVSGSRCTSGGNGRWRF